MRLIFLIVAAFLLASPTLTLAADEEALVERWRTLRDTDAPTPRFEDAVGFLTQYSGWPDEKTIRLRAETAAFGEKPERSLMREFCEVLPPISGRGMIACAMAEAADKTACSKWLRQGWIQGDFSEREEQEIISRYGDVLDEEAHIARLERQLYEEKPTAAKRTLALIPEGKRTYYNAWIGLTTHEDEDAWRSLSEAQQKSPGIIFARLADARKEGKNDLMIALAKRAPANAPYPTLWWNSRELAAREAIHEKDYSDALTILKNHGAIEGEDLADAIWLKGWLLLEFSGDAESAYNDFSVLFNQVSTPVSKARAAYWAARAASKSGDSKAAHAWYNKAAKYPTVFYGQLAHLALQPEKAIRLPSAPRFSAAQQEALEADPLARVARFCHEQNEEKLRDRFLAQLARNADSQGKLTIISNLAQELGGISSAVKIAKLALRKQAIMSGSGWPTIDLPDELGVEPALALAITRQESEFDPEAVSPANARGLMQLLPATAKHVAQQNDWSFNNRTLSDPSQNLKLGSTYLGRLIRGFDGSYILGIASYNAGPANVRRWIRENGEPPRNLAGAINWIESIPFAETRNYVQRVLENLQVYRSMDEKASHQPTLVDDLTR